jgi:hypothetical protein
MSNGTPVSEKLMKFISDVVQKETGRSPLVGTGHVKWPPDELLRANAGDPAELRVDKLVLTVDFQNKGVNKNTQNE